MMNVTTAGQHPGDGRRDDLAVSTLPAFQQAQRVALDNRRVRHGPRGEHAGQDRAQRAADAVHAEGVQRVVVAERRP